jgi:hypothetical protein
MYVALYVSISTITKELLQRKHKHILWNTSHTADKTPCLHFNNKTVLSCTCCTCLHVHICTYSNYTVQWMTILLLILILFSSFTTFSFFDNFIRFMELPRHPSVCMCKALCPWNTLLSFPRHSQASVSVPFTMHNDMCSANKRMTGSSQFGSMYVYIRESVEFCFEC